MDNGATRTLLARDTLITIQRWVRGTTTRTVHTRTVADAVRRQPTGNDFATDGGTVMVSAVLADGSDTRVVYDGKQCYAVTDDMGELHPFKPHDEGA